MLPAGLRHSLVYGKRDLACAHHASLISVSALALHVLCDACSVGFTHAALQIVQCLNF